MAVGWASWRSGRREQKKPGGFHSPFADAADQLKKVAPPTPVAKGPVKAAPAATVPAPPASADRLWQDAIGGVRPLAPKAPRATPGHVPPAPGSSHLVARGASAARARDDAETDAALADLVAGAGHFELGEHDGAAEGLAPGVDRRLLRKLRAGEYPLEARLDLHGLAAAAAEAAVARFLTDSRKQRRRAVLVIHGRGLNSDAGPVLKERLSEWLSSGRLARGVLAFTGARPGDGGAGASYVLLRKLTS